MNIDGAAITRHLRQLEAKGIVLRRKQSEDNRITREKGREQIESSKKEKERFMKGMFVNISGEERKILIHVLLQMQKNVENIKE
ncbi:MarR family transcriptional regulator [Bacillus thuringiensis]|nr:MarR family transcriptional regulator [Bacillus thuringiensis MC28]MDO8160287.1 MarR family transcriptional regulator [Bacillus toyonensis]OTX09894.1 quinone oxidoreductase [Bacillus thuringiensis serovar seoulensis]QPW47762.1 MarR family transcriptional regulator [Bacillus thuringiensis]PGC80701.1 quinone oxidoreductase [Bacillus toyonensis]